MASNFLALGVYPAMTNAFRRFTAHLPPGARTLAGLVPAIAPFRHQALQAVNLNRRDQIRQACFQFRRGEWMVRTAEGYDAAMDAQRALLKHFLATIAYRTQKALRGAPDSFADFRAGANLRTPHEIIWYMTGVLGYARTFFQAGVWQPDYLDDFRDEVGRFHLVLQDLGTLLEREIPRNGISPEQLLQGPLTDAMTHVGQLAMLRRLAGSPVPSENFVYATIRASNLGQDQAMPAAPDPSWNPDLPPPVPGVGLPEDWYQK